MTVQVSSRLNHKKQKYTNVMIVIAIITLLIRFRYVLMEGLLVCTYMKYVKNTKLIYI